MIAGLRDALVVVGLAIAIGTICAALVRDAARGRDCAPRPNDLDPCRITRRIAP